MVLSSQCSACPTTLLRMLSCSVLWVTLSNNTLVNSLFSIFILMFFFTSFKRATNLENSTYDLYTIPKESDSQNPDGKEIHSYVLYRVTLFIPFKDVSTFCLPKMLFLSVTRVFKSALCDKLNNKVCFIFSSWRKKIFWSDGSLGGKKQICCPGPHALCKPTYGFIRIWEGSCLIFCIIC